MKYILYKSSIGMDGGGSILTGNWSDSLLNSLDFIVLLTVRNI